MDPEIEQYRVVEPRGCVYWDQPELVRGGMQEKFELLETYADESHLRRYLLKCRECGQLYFFEFSEQVDWVDGDDPQFSQYVPVSSAEQAKGLAALDGFGLQRASPVLCIDFPKGAKAPAVYWRGKDPS